jgi:hypothetical protein
VIVTDEYPPYKKAILEASPNAKHETVKHSAAEYVRGDIYTNTVESAFSLLKRGIIGSWHKVSAKHLAAYLDEMTWRFNRKNPFLFRDTMLRLIHSDNLEYKELTKAALMVCAYSAFDGCQVLILNTLKQVRYIAPALGVQTMEIPRALFLPNLHTVHFYRHEKVHCLFRGLIHWFISNHFGECCTIENEVADVRKKSQTMARYLIRLLGDVLESIAMFLCGNLPILKLPVGV